MFDETPRQVALRRYLAAAVTLCGTVTFVVTVIAPSNPELAVLLSVAAAVSAGVSLLPGQSRRCGVTVLLAAVGFVAAILAWVTGGVPNWTLVVVTASNGLQAVIALVAMVLEAKRFEAEDESLRQYTAYAHYAQTYHTYHATMAQYPHPEAVQSDDDAEPPASSIADVRAKYDGTDSGAAAAPTTDLRPQVPSAGPAVAEFSRQGRQDIHHSGDPGADTSAQQQ